MGKDNSKKDSGGEFVEMAGTIMVMLLTVAGVTAGSLSLALASKARRLEIEGHGLKAILKEKLRFILGLVPVVIGLAIFLDFKLPTDLGPGQHKLFLNSLLSSTPQGNIFEERLRSVHGEVDQWNRRVAQKIKAIKQLENKQSLVNAEDPGDSYAREELQEQIDEAHQGLVQEQKIGDKLAIKYQKATWALEASKKKGEGTKSASSGPREGSETQGRSMRFTLLGLGFLLASLILSFLLGPFMGNVPGKGLYSLGTALGACFFPLVWVGLLPWRLLSWAQHKAMGAKIDSGLEASMRLGPMPRDFLSEQNLNYHVQVIGGSGSGKTNLLKVMIEDRVRRGHSVFFFDFKADIELMDWMTGLATSAGRSGDLEMISMSDPKMSYAYNPIATGSETEISSQIMNSMSWSESFYKNAAESGLMIILKVMCFLRDQKRRPFHLGHLYQFLTNASHRMEVIAEASKLIYPEHLRADLRRISEELSTSKKDNYQGLVSQLSKILNSSAGEIVSQKCETEEEFRFKEAIEEGKIAYLFMNSLKLKETASVLGKLMLQDLMKVVGGIYDDRHFVKRPTTLIIDEFASFATPDFGEFIEKARGAGISIIVAYQSRKSLDHIEENLALKINENTATKIVFQIQDSEDAEWFCGLVGTKTTEKETHQAEEGFLFGDTKTGMKSVRQVEEFMVHPNVLKRLQTGQALLVCSKVDPHHTVMNIKKANHYAEEYKRNAVLKEYPSPVPAPTGEFIHSKRLPEEIRPEDLI